MTTWRPTNRRRPKPWAALFMSIALVGCGAHQSGSIAWMHEPGLPGELARHDDGTIAGAWRETVRDGRRVRNGYALSIAQFGTFAAQRGCVATGGVLEPVEGYRYRIKRYQDMRRKAVARGGRGRRLRLSMAMRSRCRAKEIVCWCAAAAIRSSFSD